MYRRLASRNKIALAKRKAMANKIPGFSEGHETDRDGTELNKKSMNSVLFNLINLITYGFAASLFIFSVEVTYKMSRGLITDFIKCKRKIQCKHMNVEKFRATKLVIRMVISSSRQ